MQQKDITSKTRLLALVGNPARHSLSPAIQNRFITDNGIDAIYLTFEFPEERFANAFKGARDLGVYGLNITMPYKEKAFEFSEKMDYCASATGSVNTIRFDDKQGTILASGFNTDIDGFLISIKNAGFDPTGTECLVLGAGGAARSAVFALLKGNASRVYIYNRTNANAKKIRESFNEKEKIVILEDLCDKKVAGKLDFICNCTPIGMDTGDMKGFSPVPEDWDLGGKVVFETIYNPLETRLLKKGREEGAILIDGLDMLINQAASSFNKWFSIFPETQDIKKILIENHIRK